MEVSIKCLKVMYSKFNRIYDFVKLKIFLFIFMKVLDIIIYFFDYELSIWGFMFFFVFFKEFLK